MSVLNIETYPSPILSQISESVEQVDDGIRKLMDDMLETMYSRTGLGLAAPQVGVSKRVIVVDANLSDEDDYPVFMLANPEIIEIRGMQEFEEGCLSFPEFMVKIKRPSGVTVRALNRDGKEITIEAEDLLAIVLQHEIDHLDGKLILDYASPIKRQFYKKRIKKQLTKTG